jgi:hypothetical protein
MDNFLYACEATADMRPEITEENLDDPEYQDILLVMADYIKQATSHLEKLVLERKGII